MVINATWITPSTTSAELFDSIPTGFSLLSFPRPVSSYTKNKIIGGGTAFLVRDSCHILYNSAPVFNFFEASVITLELPKSKFAVFNIYRPPHSADKAFLSLSLNFRHTSLMLLLYLMNLLSLVILIFMLMIQKIQMPSNFLHFLIPATLLNWLIFLLIAVVILWISPTLLLTWHCLLVSLALRFHPLIIFLYSINLTYNHHLPLLSLISHSDALMLFTFLILFVTFFSSLIHNPTSSLPDLVIDWSTATTSLLLLF